MYLDFVRVVRAPIIEACCFLRGWHPPQHWWQMNINRNENWEEETVTELFSFLFLS